jgi:hypothetical protein
MSDYFDMSYSCICGYKFKGNVGHPPVEGDEPFRKLYIDAHPFMDESVDYTKDDEQKVFLVACPKCQTVKIGGEVW